MNRITAYTIGLGYALLLTVAAFSLVWGHALHGAGLIAVILSFAMVQLVVQLFFFLHLGRGEDGRWNLSLFCFTFFGILVVVVASVWIMAHLNSNMTMPQMKQYTNDQSTF